MLMVGVGIESICMGEKGKLRRNPSLDEKERTLNSASNQDRRDDRNMKVKVGKEERTEREREKDAERT